MDYPSDPAIGLINGKFNDGDPANGIAASLDPAAHLNAITDELLNAIIASGQTPDEADKTQIAQIFGGGGGNLLINPSFTINQSVYVSGAALANSTYGHDGWKAGAAGGDYTFAQLDTSTQITIAAGKSLIQVVDTPNVAGGTYTLSWKGTAQARIGIDTKTPAGAYAASPITVTGQTAATFMAAEFNAGTLADVQLEQGSIATVFTPRLREDELYLCKSFYQKSYEEGTAPGTVTTRGEISGYGVVNTVGGHLSLSFPQAMRLAPSMVYYSPVTGAAGMISSSGDRAQTGVLVSSTGVATLSNNNIFAGIGYSYHYTADARIY